MNDILSVSQIKKSTERNAQFSCVAVLIMPGRMDKRNRNDQELKIAVCISTYYALNGTEPSFDELCEELGFEYFPALQAYRRRRLSA